MRSLTHRFECVSRPITLGDLFRFLALGLFLVSPLLDAAPEDDTGPAVDGGPLESSAAVPDPALLARMQERVSELQSEEGPYAAPLIEVLGDLGRLYQTADDHEQACDVLSRALHVARVTDGLYSERQLRILGELIESERARNNWQQVDDYHHLALHIQNRLYEPGSDRHLAAVRRFGDWKMQAYRRELLGQGSSRNSVPDELYTLHELYANALKATDQHSSNDETVFALLYGRAKTEYEIARQMSVMPARAFDTMESRYRTRTVCGQVNGENGEVQRVCWSEQVENPRYRRAQYDERRDQVHRTVKRAEQTIDEMEQLLTASSSLDAQQKAGRRARLEKLGSRLEKLESRVGRLSIRHW